MKADYDLEERLPNTRAVRGSTFGVGCSTFVFQW